MAIPDFQTIMRPVLALLADDQDHAVTEIRAHLAEDFSLTHEDLEAMLPSGRAKTFANRTAWAITYLYQTKLPERPKRSVYRITPRGHEILTQNPSRVERVPSEVPGRGIAAWVGGRDRTGGGRTHARRANRRGLRAVAGSAGG
jgi:restriction endonuclease Mrr